MIENRRTRIIVTALFLFCFVSILALLLSIYISKVNKVLEKENAVRLSEVTDYVSAHMTTVVKDTQSTLEVAAAAISEMPSEENKIAFISELAYKNSFVYAGYAGPDGMLYASDSSQSVDISNEPYFQSAIKGETAVSNLIRKIFTNKAVSGVMLSVPMKTEEGTGAVVAMMDVGSLNDAFSMESFGGEGYSYIFDKKGAIVMHSKSIMFHNLFTAWKLVDFEQGYHYDKFMSDVQNDVEGITCFSNMGIKQYAYYRPIPFNDWSVVNVVSKKTVSEKSDRLVQEILIIGVAIVLFSTLLMYLMMRVYHTAQERKRETDAKSAFLANMSHEIRTPMNAIVGISEIMLHDNLSAKHREQIKNIQSAGKGLLTIINDILDISKIESGKFTIAEELYDLDSMLHDIVTIASIRIGDKPIEFFVEPDMNLPRRLIGDIGRMKQLLINIVGNAVKFTQIGSIRLIISGEKTDTGWTIRMEVRDTGIGIKKENLSKLFESFSQVDVHRNRNIEGTGLGLAISKSLCEMMGGNITVTSEYGSGTSFFMSVHQKDADSDNLICPVVTGTPILIYEPIDMRREFELSCMEKLHLRYQLCESMEAFIELADSGNYEYAMIGCRILRRSLIDKKFKKTQIIGVTGLNEQAAVDSSDCNVSLPLLTQQLANVIGGVKNVHILKREGFDRDTIEPLPNVTVLIVDDNEVNVVVAEGLMAPYKMHIEHVFSGIEAVNSVQKKEYDLILLDYMMPGMDGFETLQQIRSLPEQKYQNLPIVALTANAASDAKKNLLEKGFDGYLSKPIDTYKLNEVLKKFLKKINDERTVKDIAPYEKQMSTAKNNGTLIRQFPTPEVDFNDGLLRMGSLDAYLKLLGIYRTTTKERMEHMTEWLHEDIKRFHIEAHGLKSASASISAVSFAASAEKLEFLSKSGFSVELEKKLPSFLSQGRNVLKEIDDFYSSPEQQLSFTTRKEEIQEPEAAVILSESQDLRHSHQRSGSHKRRHIAVVDDNQVNLQLAENVLGELYDVTKLDSGEKLLQFMEQEEQPDLILLDIMMPGKSGYETLDLIQKNEQWMEIPVIFLTAQQDIASERKGFRMGAKDFIVKPFDNIVMLSRIQSQLELYRYQTELKQIISNKTLEIESLQHMITISWAEIIESRDGTTGSHVRNTTVYFKALFDLLQRTSIYGNQLKGYDINDLLRASSLHDIGKIGISDLILKKPGALTTEEFDTMKQHAKIGADMISKIIDQTHPDQFLVYAREMAYYHHERWDGTGYPAGLKGNEIPLHVQLLTIADIFEALTAVRPYKRAFTFEEAVEIMIEDRGKIYNPELFDTFYSKRKYFQTILEAKK